MKLIYKTAFRYTFSKAKNQLRSTIVIIFGVCVSFIAMIVLGSVMNGLQTSQLDRLRNLDSFDIVIENTKLDIASITSLEDVDYAYYFIDANVMISNLNSGYSGTARIRGIDLSKYVNARTMDDLSYRTFNSNTSEAFTLSTTMMNRFNANIGDSLQVTFLKKGKTTVAPYNRNYYLSGLYVSSLSDFSSNTAFINLDELLKIYGNDALKIGVFCNSNVDNVCFKISSLDSNAKITSWKEANKALYSALLLEKSLMYLFLGFVFIIISVNLKNSTRRLLDNKVGESAILRAFGLSKRGIYTIFILQGVIATSIGSIIGLGLGYIIVKNLGLILSFFDSLIYKFTGGVSYLAALPLLASFNWSEALLIMLYILVLTIIFAYLGCKKIHKLEIMEVLSGASDKV